MAQLDLTGQRFGKLVVLKKEGKDNSGHSTWLCQCDCGNLKVARGSHLKRGYIQSCGCIVIDSLKARSIKHGLEGTRLYRIWRGMIIRCYNPKSNRYHRYGERGITVCDEWRENPLAFHNWAIKNGYGENLTLDRIDNDGPYNPDNCRWITMKEQLNHKSNNRNVTINGVTKTVAQWADSNGIKIGTIYSRLKRGWDIVDAVTKPVLKVGESK